MRRVVTEFRHSSLWPFRTVMDWAATPSCWTQRQRGRWQKASAHQQLPGASHSRKRDSDNKTDGDRSWLSVRFLLINFSNPRKSAWKHQSVSSSTFNILLSVLVLEINTENRQLSYLQSMEKFRCFTDPLLQWEARKASWGCSTARHGYTEDVLQGTSHLGGTEIAERGNGIKTKPESFGA